jgi:hypothetical protein
MTHIAVETRTFIVASAFVFGTIAQMTPVSRPRCGRHEAGALMPAIQSPPTNPVVAGGKARSNANVGQRDDCIGLSICPALGEF